MLKNLSQSLQNGVTDIWLYCLDHNDLTKHFEKNNIIVKLIAKSQGVTVFTIINMNEGYWLVELILARES